MAKKQNGKNKLLTKRVSADIFTLQSIQLVDRGRVSRSSVGGNLLSGQNKTRPIRKNMEDLKYVVPSIGKIEEVKDSPLCLVENPASRLRTDVTDEELRQAVLRHCKTSYEQAESIKH